MNVEQTIIDKVHALPQEKQEKVLEFVEQLQSDGSFVVPVENSADDQKEELRYKELMAIIGIARSGRNDLSEKVDELLDEGANREEGWSFP